ncbi:MAG: NAD-dependent epimerase/dehydratase family protein [Thaumarchaeota archaeon]|nr:NAD-dependent epimerase/dehydratase family protein [Nitrososphaerota archaeon]
MVTGAAGFIGSHLAERLLKDKFRVIGIDCFTNYYSKDIKQKNLETCLQNENFTFIEDDLMDVDLATIFKKSKLLFHEAAQPGVRSSWGKEFDTYVKDNIQVTQRILEIAKDVKTLEKIVMASSSSIYGNQPGKMSEDTLPRPVSPYGVTKLASENLGFVYAQNFNLPVTSLRYFTVYGPRQRPDMAFTRFIRANLEGSKITIYGNGSQSRDFTFVSDIVDANILVSESKIHGNALNIGGGSVHTIKEVIKMIENTTGVESKIVFEPPQKGDVLKTESNIEKASKILRYKPNIMLKKGLIEQVNWFKKTFEC